MTEFIAFDREQNIEVGRYPTLEQAEEGANNASRELMNTLEDTPALVDSEILARFVDRQYVEFVITEVRDGQVINSYNLVRHSERRSRRRLRTDLWYPMD